MILSDKRILEEIEKGTIKITPYDRECLGSNSYDVHLGKWLATYNEHLLDAKKHNLINYFEIPEEGFVLYPHIFYLGVTQEYTETHAHVPFLEGKSSTGRLGIDIHATAGKGDVGFCGHWTLEISVKQPVKVYKEIRGLASRQCQIFELQYFVWRYFEIYMEDELPGLCIIVSSLMREIRSPAIGTYLHHFIIPILQFSSHLLAA